MSDRPPPDEHIRCVELVELLTDYLDDKLPDHVRRRVDDHLRDCAGCRAALAQWRTVVEVTGGLTTADVADVDPYVRDRLLSTLRLPRRR
jgi:anti-sigma factor RsiW